MEDKSFLIYHQRAKHHCEGASFMAGQGPFFSVLTPVCTNPCCSLINLLPVQFNSSEFFLFSRAVVDAAASHPPPPRHRLVFRHSSAGRYSSARWSALLNDGWRMPDAAPIFFQFHKMLTDTVKISFFETVILPPPPLLRMYTCRPESLEFSLRLLHCLNSDD